MQNSCHEASFVSPFLPRSLYILDKEFCNASKQCTE